MLKVARDKWMVKVVVCFVVLAFGSYGFAAGLQPARIMPTNKVILYKGTQKVGEFSAEAPFPQGVMLECQGKCAAKMDGLYLVAEDKSLFSVNKTSASRALQLNQGTVYFAVSSSPQTLVIATPQRTFTAEQIIVNASTSGQLKGYVSAGPQGAELGVLEGGSMVIATDEGQQTLKSGQRITVAAESGAAAARGKGTGTKADKSAAGAGAESEGTSALMIGGIAAAVAAAGGIALAAGGGGGGGGGDSDVSPSQP